MLNPSFPPSPLAFIPPTPFPNVLNGSEITIFCRSATKLETNASIEATNKYLSAAVAMVVMDPYEAEALMRFKTIVFINGLSTKSGTLIETSTSLIFVGKEFVMTNGVYKKCKTTPNLAIIVANEQRISTNKVFCPSVFTIDGHEFTNLQFRVLRHFKRSDIILGLQAL